MPMNYSTFILEAFSAMAVGASFAFLLAIVGGFIDNNNKDLQIDKRKPGKDYSKKLKEAKDKLK